MAVMAGVTHQLEIPGRKTPILLVTPKTKIPVQGLPILAMVEEQNRLGPLEPAGGPATVVNPSSPQLQNPIIITIANALLTLKENQFLLITGVVGIISVAVLRRWWIRRQQP